MNLRLSIVKRWSHDFLHEIEKSSRSFEIRMHKILTLKQNRLAKCLRKRIAETVTKIQPGFVPILHVLYEFQDEIRVSNPNKSSVNTQNRPAVIT